jgi:hypothetical protein
MTEDATSSVPDVCSALWNGSVTLVVRQVTGTMVRSSAVTCVPGLTPASEVVATCLLRDQTTNCQIFSMNILL